MEIFCFSSVKSRARERQLVCSDRHSNYWGKPLWFKLLFYGWTVVKKTKNRTFPQSFRKVELLPQRFQKKIRAITRLIKTRIRWKNFLKCVKGNILSCPIPFFLVSCAANLKLSYETPGQIKKGHLWKMIKILHFYNFLTMKRDSVLINILTRLNYTDYTQQLF